MNPLRRAAAGAALWASLGLAAAPPVLAQVRFDFDTTPGHLPKDVVPKTYALHFDLDPARADFSARAAIALEIRRPVAAVVLHAHGLSASAASLAAADGSERPLQVEPGPQPQTWALRPADGRGIAAGPMQLRIAYRGSVQQAGEGLYGVTLPSTKPGAPPERMLATQLEAVFARMVFPSFDEPAFRAVFDIEVQAPGGFEVLSNMPVAQATATPGGGQLVHFEPTPPMPSYLVALAVGHFDRLEGNAGGVPLRLFTAPGKSAQARDALAVSEQVVPYYADYFGVPYALPKLDQLAVPGVRNGAMEDWGLISYTEPALLVDPARSSPRTPRAVFSTVAHEIAHQWFGNLVTAASWEEIWLNEAFATWMSTKATEHFRPEWNDRLNDRRWLEATMLDDALAASRAIRSGAVSESAVFDVFDGITYAKGGAVLSMLEQWLGPDIFRRGLAAYMAERRLSNATAGDLWFHMAAASGRDVAAVASTWTDQPGLPLVHLSSRCRDGRSVVTLTQQRFAMTPKGLPAQAWKLPIRLAQGDAQATLLLEAPHQEVELGACTDAPVVGNAGGIGYYRVAYAPKDFTAIARAFARLPPADRVALLSDSFALAQAGQLPMLDALRLLDAVPAIDDASRTPLYGTGIAMLSFLDTALTGTTAQATLRARARALLRPALARLGWEPVAGESAEEAKLRSDAIAALARFDDPEVVHEAFRRFDAQAQRPLAAGTRAAVIEAVGAHADRAHVDALLAGLRSAAGEEDRWTYAAALASNRNAARIAQWLPATLDGSLPPNIAASLPGLVGERSPHQALAYAFVHRHWKALAALSGNMFGSAASLLPDAASGAYREADARRLLADQRALVGADGAQAAARTAARIELNARVRAREAGPLAAALAGGPAGR